jgi:hypothetical protein
MHRKLFEALQIAQAYIVACEEALEYEGIGTNNKDAEEKWRAIEVWLATIDTSQLPITWRKIDMTSENNFRGAIPPSAEAEGFLAKRS